MAKSDGKCCKIFLSILVCLLSISAAIIYCIELIDQFWRGIVIIIIAGVIALVRLIYYCYVSSIEKQNIYKSRDEYRWDLEKYASHALVYTTISNIIFDILQGLALIIINNNTLVIYGALIIGFWFHVINEIFFIAVLSFKSFERQHIKCGVTWVVLSCTAAHICNMRVMFYEVYKFAMLFQISGIGVSFFWAIFMWLFFLCTRSDN
mmetsp:Transcript_98976/g.121175  ORF Transcript_98976/g.121175 Transcript_98976/m.121175 type:complete len:207 (-) Transcript_98976:46-666(-)